MENLGLRGQSFELAEHAEADRGDEILKRRRALAGLFFEVLVVAVNRVVFRLPES